MLASLFAYLSNEAGSTTAPTHAPLSAPCLFYTPDVPRCFLPLLLALSGIGSAGGVEPINRSQPLHWVPGVVKVFTTPSDQMVTKAFTNAVTLRSNGQLLQVFVTTGVVSDDLDLSAINHLLAWVPSATASTAQKQALVRVAQAYLRGCFLNVTSQQLTALDALERANWESGGWQEKRVQGVDIGWSDGNGFGFGNGQGANKLRTGLDLRWPVEASRCQF